MRRAAFLFCAAASTGCYTYSPMSAGLEPQPGSVLRAELTAQGSESLAPTIGANTRTVQGRLVSAGPASLRFAMLETATARGVSTEWKGEGVEIPRPLVADLRVRRFSRLRTLLFAGGIVAGAVGLGGSLGLFGGGPDRGGRGPGPPPR